MEAGLSSPEVRRHLQAEAQHHRRVMRESGISAAARELLEEMRCHQEEACAQVRLSRRLGGLSRVIICIPEQYFSHSRVCCSSPV